MTYSGPESKSEKNQHEFVWSCQVLGNSHGTLFTGHEGVDKTKARLLKLLVAEYGFDDFRLHQDL